MRINLKNEYLFLVSISLVLLVIVLISDVIRTILGLPFVLLLPGYLLTVALFPGAKELEGLDRIALSMGLSIIIVPILGLFNNYLEFGIRLVPMMFAMTIFNIVLMVIGWYRRNKLPEKERFLLFRRLQKSQKTKLARPALLITSVLLLVTVSYLLFPPNINSHFTEFYITGQDGKATGYPRQLAVGEYGMVNAGVINNEHQSTIYRMEIRVNGDLIQTIAPISLEHQEKWEEPVFFNSLKPSDKVKVEFLLFKENLNNQPYRQLKLWVEIQDQDKSDESKPGTGIL